MSPLLLPSTWGRMSDGRAAACMFLSRLAIVLLAMVADTLIEDYDTSTVLLPSSPWCAAPFSASPIPSGEERLLRGTVADVVAAVFSGDAPRRWRALRGLRNWDGIHFTHIAARGYTSEHHVAFFPLLPAILRLWSAISDPLLARLPTAGAASPWVCLLAEDMGPVLANAAAFALAGLALRRLTRRLMHEDSCLRAAFPEAPVPLVVGATTLAYVLTPAGIFTVAVYTESIFAALSFAGLVLLQSSREVSRRGRTVSALWLAAGATACFLLGAFTRANGLLSSLYFGGPVLELLLTPSTGAGRGHRLVMIVSYMLMAVAAMIPFFILNYLAYGRFCVGRSGVCPQQWWGFYSNIQAVFWNVYFLGAFTLKNAPNFIIALPQLVVIAVACSKYFKPPTPSSKAEKDIGKGKRGASFSCKLVSHARHWLCRLDPFFTPFWIMVIMSCTLMHVQVIVRFLFATPVIHWLGAAILVRAARAVRCLFIVWCLAWIVVGTAFFTNFFPWT